MEDFLQLSIETGPGIFSLNKFNHESILKGCLCERSEAIRFYSSSDSRDCERLLRHGDALTLTPVLRLSKKTRIVTPNLFRGLKTAQNRC